MKHYLINHSWESFVKTKEYCGFIDKNERDLVNLDDIIVYYGQGVIFGTFKVIKKVDDEFTSWKKPYPYQIKLSLLFLSNKGLGARSLQERFKIAKEDHTYSNIIELSEEEYNKIKQAIEDGIKEIKFE